LDLQVAGQWRDEVVFERQIVDHDVERNYCLNEFGETGHEVSDHGVYEPHSAHGRATQYKHFLHDVQPALPLDHRQRQKQHNQGQECFKDHEVPEHLQAHHVEVEWYANDGGHHEVKQKDRAHHQLDLLVHPLELVEFEHGPEAHAVHVEGLDDAQQLEDDEHEGHLAQEQEHQLVVVLLRDVVLAEPPLEHELEEHARDQHPRRELPDVLHLRVLALQTVLQFVETLLHVVVLELLAHELEHLDVLQPLHLVVHQHHVRVVEVVGDFVQVAFILGTVIHFLELLVDFVDRFGVAERLGVQLRQLPIHLQKYPFLTLHLENVALQMTVSLPTMDI